MTHATDSDVAVVEAVGRLTVYSLLATGFMFPTASRLETIRSTLLPGMSMLDLGDDLNAMAASLPDSLPADLDLLRAQYTQLFPPIASQDAPGYETGYRGDGVFQQSTIMADIAGFYRAHGLRPGGSERERPDHITVELEFMAVVARKEAMALGDGDGANASICRETAAGFLSDHLGCWGRAFGLRAAAVSASAWYTALAELLISWIATDLEILGVEPVEASDDPLPQEPPDDGTCGPCPAPGIGGTQ